MAYIKLGDKERIDPAADSDIDRLFAESRIFGVAVHQDKNHSVQATVTGESAMVLYVDQKKAQAKTPGGRIDRDTAIAILKSYLGDGTLHPDFDWPDAGLPTVSTGRGCGVPAGGILVVLLVAYGFWSMVAD